MYFLFAYKIVNFGTSACALVEVLSWTSAVSISCKYITQCKFTHNIKLPLNSKRFQG